MSKTYSKARVSLTQREMKERAKRREFKARNVSAHTEIQLLDRRFDYQQCDIYEMLNMRHDTHYSE